MKEKQVELGMWKRRREEKRIIPKRGGGIGEEINPGKLGGSRFLRIVGGESVRDGTCPVIRLDRRRQQRERHHLARTLHFAI